MADLIEKLESYREKSGLKKADMARLLGCNSLQQYNNWVYRGSLSKEFFERAILVLNTSEEGSKLSIEILEKLEKLSPDKAALVESMIDGLLDSQAD